MKKKTLPRKPSALIRLALKDLAAVAKKPGYEIHMDVWHEFEEHVYSVCEVCLAGSVMAETLQVPRCESIDPYDLDCADTTRNKLLALDYFHCGRVRQGLLSMNISENLALQFPEWTEVSPYAVDPKKFRRDMFKMARKLEAAGL